MMDHILQPNALWFAILANMPTIYTIVASVTMVLAAATIYDSLYIIRYAHSQMRTARHTDYALLIVSCVVGCATFLALFVFNNAIRYVMDIALVLSIVYNVWVILTVDHKLFVYHRP